MREHLSGLGNVQFFVGVVEDRNDTEGMGRVKVRCHGVHTDNKSELPTENLPWAIPINPITSASVSGIGRSPTGIVEGSWVVGFFMDDKHQQPMVLGTIAGRPASASQGEGYADPQKNYPLDDDELSKLGESDVNRLAREDAESHAILINKRKAKEELGEVKIAKGDEIPTIWEWVKEKLGFIERTTWKEPNPRYGGQDEGDYEFTNVSTYPFNHVTFTEGGHLFEVDDTDGSERLHAYHAAGTFVEIQADGTVIMKGVGNTYSITAKDNNVVISGNSNISVAGTVNLKAKDMVTEVEDDYILAVGGNYIKKVGGNELKEIDTNATQHISKDRKTNVDGDQTTQANNKLDNVTNDSYQQTGNTFGTLVGNTISLDIPNDFIIKTGNNIILDAGGKLSLGGNTMTSIASVGDLAIKTSANQTVTVSGSLTENITGAVVETYSSTLSTNTAGAKTEKAKSMDIDATEGDIDMDASANINLN